MNKQKTSSWVFLRSCQIYYIFRISTKVRLKRTLKRTFVLQTASLPVNEIQIFMGIWMISMAYLAFHLSYYVLGLLCTHKYEEILSKHFPFYHQNYGLLSTLSLAEIMQLFSRPIIRFILTIEDAAYIVLVVLIA